MSTNAFSHLAEEARGALSLPVDERLKYLKEAKLWVPYEAATHALKVMQEIHDTPRDDRMPCALILAVADNGKSRLLAKFLKDNPDYKDPKTGRLIVSALMISAPNEADEGEFYENIVRAFKAPFRPGEKTKVFKSQAMDLLCEYKVKTLLMDEFNVICKGTGRAQGSFLQRIRLIAKDLQIGIIGAGTRESVNFLNIDPQFASRFDARALPKWTEGVAIRSFLGSLERRLPLPESSGLVKKDLSKAILDATDGTIGEITKVTRLLAQHAISKGEPRITDKMLENIDWTKPSHRVANAYKKLDGRE